MQYHRRESRGVAARTTGSGARIVTSELVDDRACSSTTTDTASAAGLEGADVRLWGS